MNDKGRTTRSIGTAATSGSGAGLGAFATDRPGDSPLDEVVLQTALGTPDVDRYPAHDHLYSTVCVFSAAGVVAEYVEYDAYGRARYHVAAGADDTWLTADDDIADESAVGNPVGFTGQRLDVLDNGDLRLMSYKNRVYDPDTGRFLQRDPLGYADGMAMYEYVTSRPVKRVDPLGLFNDTFGSMFARDRCEAWIDKELKDLSWLNPLPPCPPTNCNIDFALWEQENKAISDAYHPGSDACYRSRYKEEYGDAGQQCCYKEGHLLTTGLKAGTPDKRSPSRPWNTIPVAGHYWHDVRMFNYCKKYLGDDWVTDEYHRVRPPSTGVPYEL